MQSQADTGGVAGLDNQVQPVARRVGAECGGV